MYQHLKTFSAATIVYLVVAACSAGSNSNRSAGTGGTGATSSTGGSGGMLADSGLDALADALGDAMDAASEPVPDADAAPAPTVVSAQCDKSYRPTGAAVDTLYAEVAFPGKTADDLRTLVAEVEYEEPGPPGYYRRTTTPWYRDGFAAVECGPDSTLYKLPKTVTFTLP